ncbi:hypothetical protein NLU13_8697 [Sarocladium strictum]|uniref:Uncharacterized protein n=1 Tax=Sarocladium strictum TaxID=5046 RepID=A0AA39GCP7_SARSR|nr:hypothetical protein NLU13_8697 [Sarocladium strictum]
MRNQHRMLDCGLHPPDKAVHVTNPTLCGNSIRAYFTAVRIGASRPQVNLCERMKGRIITALIELGVDDALSHMHEHDGRWDVRFNQLFDHLDTNVWPLCGATFSEMGYLQPTVMHYVLKIAKSVSVRRAGRPIRQAAALHEWRNQPLLAVSWLRDGQAIAASIEAAERADKERAGHHLLHTAVGTATDFVEGPTDVATQNMVMRFLDKARAASRTYNLSDIVLLAEGKGDDIVAKGADTEDALACQYLVRRAALKGMAQHGSKYDKMQSQEGEDTFLGALHRLDRDFHGHAVAEWVVLYQKKY